jgi:hypothetical protein
VRESGCELKKNKKKAKRCQLVGSDIGKNKKRGKEKTPAGKEKQKYPGTAAMQIP